MVSPNIKFSKHIRILERMITGTLLLIIMLYFIHTTYSLNYKIIEFIIFKILPVIVSLYFIIGMVSIFYGDINKYAIRVTYFDQTFSPGENHIFKNYGECVKWITENFDLPKNGFSHSINNTYYAENG